MFSLKHLLTAKVSAKSKPAGPETGPVKMNLDERMAFRRDLLYEAIRVTLQAHGILSASYKFKVVRNDKRGHQYSVMIDLSTDFLHNPEGRPERLVALGHAIARNALARYGLGVAGVYWQVNEEIKGFEASRPDLGVGGAGVSVPAALSGTQKYEHASARELAAFEAAWHEGQELQLGDRVYSSDLAPLSGDTGGDSSR